jgi:hypothetical protein
LCFPAAHPQTWRATSPSFFLARRISLFLLDKPPGLVVNNALVEKRYVP